MSCKNISFYIFVIALVLLSYGSFQTELFQVSEGREGVVVQELLKGDSIILPLRHAQLVPSKPILYHWLVALLVLAGAELSVFALRFPAVVSASCMCLAVFLFGKRYFDCRVGLFAAGILTSSYGFLRLAKSARVDMLFATLITVATLVWLSAATEKARACEDPLAIRSSTYLLFAILCGLAVLTKGPLGLLLPLLVIAGIAISYWGVDGLRSIFRAPLVLALLIPAPWYLCATLIAGEDFLGRQIVFENVQRFVGGEGVNTKPPWFYFYHIWLQSSPWSFILAPVCIWSFIQNKASRFKHSFLERSLLTWAISIFVFLTIASGKRRAYLLPLLPPLSLYLAVWVAQMNLNSLLNSKQFRNSVYAIWSVLSIVSLFLFSVAFWSPENGSLPPSVDLVLSSWSYLFTSRMLLYLLAALLFASGSIFYLVFGFRNKSIAQFGVGLFLLIQFAMLYTGGIFFSIKAHTHSYEPFASAVSQVLKGEKLVLIREPKNEVFDSFAFHLGGEIAMISEFEEPPFAPGFYLSSREWYENLSLNSREGLEICARGGRLKDARENYFLLLLQNSSGFDSGC